MDDFFRLFKVIYVTLTIASKQEWKNEVLKGLQLFTTRCYETMGFNFRSLKKYIYLLQMAEDTNRIEKNEIDFGFTGSGIVFGYAVSI